jgi:hypothetical protein
VTASASDCEWTAAETAAWITITSGSGTGDGTVTYSVAANTSSNPREDTITVDGQIYTVTQEGVPCTYTISPTSDSFTYTGGTGSFTVTASASDCEWTATETASWITITSGSGTGDGTVAYSVDTNTSSNPREDTITVDGQVHTVTQTGITGTSSFTGVVSAQGSSVFETVSMVGFPLILRGPDCPPNGNDCFDLNTTTTGTNGSYTFSNLPTGTYQLELQGYDPAIFTFTPQTSLITTDGSTNTVNILGNANPNTIIGSVYYFGTPVEGMTVQLLSGSTLLQTTSTLVSGMYHFAVSSVLQTYTIRIIPSSVGLDPALFATTEMTRTAGGGTIVMGVNFSAY